MARPLRRERPGPCDAAEPAVRPAPLSSSLLQASTTAAAAAAFPELEGHSGEGRPGGSQGSARDYCQGRERLRLAGLAGGAPDARGRAVERLGAANAAAAVSSGAHSHRVEGTYVPT